MRALGGPDVAESTMTSAAPPTLSPVLILRGSFLPALLGEKGADFHRMYHSGFPFPG